jgi:hypothetical protein
VVQSCLYAPLPARLTQMLVCELQKKKKQQRTDGFLWRAFRQACEEWG